MSIMISEVYDAFLSAGTPEDKARKAAEALTVYENRFNKIEADIAVSNANIVVLKWMCGFTLTVVMAIFYLLLKSH